MQTDQQSIFNSLKDKGPETWREYLRPFEKGQPLTGLNMLVIFHHVAPKAKEQDSLDWAEVAVRAAELEARFRVLPRARTMSIRLQSLSSIS